MSGFDVGVSGGCVTFVAPVACGVWLDARRVSLLFLIDETLLECFLWHWAVWATVLNQNGLYSDTAITPKDTEEKPGFSNINRGPFSHFLDINQQQQQ